MQLLFKCREQCKAGINKSCSFLIYFHQWRMLNKMNTGAFHGKFHFHYLSSDLWASYKNFPNISPSNEKSVLSTSQRERPRRSHSCGAPFNVYFRISVGGEGGKENLSIGHF